MQDRFLQLFILFSFNIISRNCPFESYKDALITDGITHQIEEYQVIMQPDIGNSFGFGLWILPNSFLEKDRQIQNLFQVKNKNNEVYFQGKLSDQQLPTINLVLQFPGGTIQNTYQYQELQNVWTFILYVMIPNKQKLIIQTSKKSPWTFQLQKIIDQETLTYIIGNFENNSLYQFSGKLSKISFFTNFNYDITKFEYFSKLCVIPNPVIGRQIFFVCKELNVFQNDKILSTSFEQFGNRYIISGWAKYNYDFITYQILYGLIRVSKNEFKFPQKQFGDDLFKLEAGISDLNLQGNKIKITIDSYCVPNLFSGCKISNINNIDKYIEIIYTDHTSNKFQQGLLSWHYFQYEYGRTNYQQELILFQLYFFNSLGLMQQRLGNFQRFQFVNDKFYVFVGENDVGYNLLSASLFDIKIEFFYNDDQTLLLTCHPTCKECDGPLSTNCKSCFENQFRLYQNDLRSCECITDYYQFGDESVCKFYEENFYPISQVEKDIPKICIFGQFYYPFLQSEPKCLQCPQYKQNQFNCIDCLYNSTTWYLEPICQHDLKQRGKSIDDGFNYKIRNILDTDIYIVDEYFNIEIIIGAYKFCDPQIISDCHFINKIYLGKLVYIKCKNEFTFQNNQCIQSSLSSILSPFYYIKNEDCIVGTYQKEGYCNKCPFDCQECIYDQNLLQVKCIRCQTGYAILANSCIKCGLNCKICQVIYDSSSKITQLQCLKCLDDQQYFLSSSKINCLQNEIIGCHSVLQMKKGQFYVSNSFSKNLDSITLCAYCHPLQIYDYGSNSCKQDTSKYMEQSVCLKKFYGPNGGYCYLSESVNNSHNFYVNCQTYISYCNLCQKNVNLQTYICLQCIPGFYANRLSGLCQICPQELENCEQCGQQQILSQDYWIFEQRPFYRQFLELQNSFEFQKNGQSQNINDYEIICLKCKAGYVIYKNKCIQYCSKDCKECILNDNGYECVKCENTQKGRMLTILNNQCIKCPENCSLCRQRSDNEVKGINQLFRNKNFSKYSFQCLKSYNDKQYIYDDQLGQFIYCQNQIKYCENQIRININLYCDFQKFQYDLNNSNEKQKFLQQNVYHEELFSNQSFYYFENYEFYLKANAKTIKSILIYIQSQDEQICHLNQEATLSQKFGENVFSVLNVSIILNFPNTVTFILQGNLQFQNFNLIQIYGVNFITNVININNFINFSSVYPQEIKLQKINFQTKSGDSLQQQIIFQNLRELLIDDFILQNYHLIDINSFINIKYDNFIRQIKIQNLTIQNSQFSNSNFFEFELGQKDQITISNCNINGSFFNSSFIIVKKQLTQNINQYNGIVEIDQININIVLKNTVYFIDIEGSSYFSLTRLIFFKSQIFQSQFLNSCPNILLNFLVFKDLQLYQKSILIQNSNYLIGEVFLQLIDISFENIECEQVSRFIRLSKLNTQTQILEINKLNLINNYCNIVNQISSKIEHSLIFLNIEFITIQNLRIQKKYGQTEIIVSDSQNVIFNNTKVYSSEFSNNLLGLHKYLQCFLENLSNKQFPEVIIIFSSRNVYIDNLQIYGSYFYNSPFILIKSAELELITQEESIIIQNIQSSNNLLIQTNDQQQLSLIQIKSKQNVQIILKNLNYQNNILHQYIQNNLKSSATLLNIDCGFCDFYMSNSQIINNTVFNGTDSIIFVNVKSVTLENNIFNSNSLFFYQLIQPYLLWEFDEQIEIFIENIKEVFLIKSFSGNGLFIAEYVNFTLNVVSNSQGKEGGCFKIQGKKNTQILINDLTLINISTLFQSKEEYGGALFIDGLNSQQLYMVSRYFKVNQIFCINQGGLFYIKVENILTNIEISNVIFSEVFATQGSFLYLKFYYQSSHKQILSINQIQGNNTFEGIQKYFEFYKTIEVDDIEKLSNNKTLFYIESGSELRITQLIIYNSFYESLLVHKNALQVNLSQISVCNSSISNSFIQISFIETKQCNFMLIQSEFLQLTFIKPNLTECDLRQIAIPNRQFSCSNNFHRAPDNLNNYLKSKTSPGFIGCLLQKINQNPLGLLILNGLSNLTQITVRNLQMEQIFCTQCLYGIISFHHTIQPLKSSSIVLRHIDIHDSICGLCCLLLNSNLASKNDLSSNLRYQVQIFDYQCYNNIGQQGTCLFINQINTQIKNSIFESNSAIKNGGAILVQGKMEFIVKKSLIENNVAEIGGGLYLTEQFMMQIQKLQTYVIKNEAILYGDNLAGLPIKLSIIFNNTNIPLETSSKFLNRTFQIDEISSKYQKSYFYLPSGQNINSYSQYNPSNRIYQLMNISLQIVALQFDNTVTLNLVNTSCKIQSRNYNFDEKDDVQIFTNNYTNINLTYFDIDSQSYNLNNLILYYGYDNSPKKVLQLQLSCNSISVPIFNQQYPYNVINTHDNYALRINIKTYPCQLGEIQNQTYYYCQKCDSSLGFYSLQLNQYKCQLKDEISTIDVKPAQLKLRPGYWRSYFDSNIISKCVNLPQNCLGDWIEGDNSCIIGHLGALCEQCDIENVRGDGKYSENEKFTCQQCSDNYSNIFIIIIISIWTLISLYIAVNGNVKIQLEFTKLSPFTRHRLARNLNKTQSGALIKILTNYFQIIASITTFRLNFPKIFDDTANTFGTPILTFVQSLDCFLIQIFNLEIHYSKVIWLLFLQIVYILQFSFLFYLGTICKLIKSFQIVFITTLLYVYIYFQPDIIGSLISLLSYREISGYLWIQANMAYRFDTQKHLEWIIKFCIPLLLLFSVLIPFILFMNLFQSRKNLDNRKVRMRYGYLYHEYKNSAYFWEIVKIFEKQLIIFFQRFYEDQIVLKGVFILTISYLYQQLNSYFRPYYLNNLNQLDYYSANICMISFALSIGAYVSQQINQNNIEIIFILFVTFSNFFYSTNLLLKIVNEYLRNFECNSGQFQNFLRNKIPFLLKFKCVREKLMHQISKKKKLMFLMTKFKQRALTLAKGSIYAKKMISQTWRSSLDSNGQLDTVLIQQENISLKRRSIIFCSLENSFQIKKQDLELK